MSTIEVNKITPVSGGSTVQVGESGDTINIPSGATLANAGSVTGLPASSISSGTIATARLGSGTASSSTVLFGDQTFKTAPGGAMELLSSATRTSGTANQVYMTDFMDSSQYVAYKAYLSFKNTGNGNNQFFNFTSSGGTTMEATNYYGAGNILLNQGGSLSNNTRAIATNENIVSWVASASTRTAFMEFTMCPKGLVTDQGVSTVFYQGQIDKWTGSRYPQYVTGAAYYVNSTVPTGFVIGASGGSWERYELRVYGLKKA
jgi:hypothetical protein